VWHKLKGGWFLIKFLWILDISNKKKKKKKKKNNIDDSSDISNKKNFFMNLKIKSNRNYFIN